jgi:hypothetical protein
MHEPTLSAPVMRGFYDELPKTAGVPQELLHRLGRVGTRSAIGAGVGSGLGLGLGAGALVGGARAGKDSYGAARERGASAPGALLSAIGGGLGGAVRGAAKGAVLGAGAGGLAGALTPTRTLAATRGLQKLDNTAGTLSNFGQRQVHSLSGWKPGGAARSVERIGAGAAPARKELAELGKGLAEGVPVKSLDRAAKSLAAADKAQEMGLTSLPGYAKSLKTNGLLPTVSAGMKSQWDAAGGKGKALMLGLPALSVAQAARAPEGEGKPGRGERIGKVVGSTLGGVAAPLSLGGSLALSAGLERAGGAVGKGMDRLRRGKVHPPEVRQEPTRPPATEPGDTGQHTVEHVYGTGFNGGGLE